jgi:hypothetical protein
MDEHLPGVQGDKAKDGFKEGGLASAVGANNCHLSPRRYGEADMLQDGVTVVGYVDILKLDQG